jgi:hypothetical protein
MNDLVRGAEHHVDIKESDGQISTIDETGIMLVAGPYPSEERVISRAYIYGASSRLIVSQESAEEIVGRMHVVPPLAKLTRPNQTAVWVKGAAVANIHAASANDQEMPGSANTILYLGRLRQAIRENLGEARKIINAHGGKV